MDLISQEYRAMSKPSNWLIANLGVVAVLYTRYQDLFAYHLQTRLSNDRSGQPTGRGWVH